MDGRSIDIGLFAEALIYYDRVIINPTNPMQFAELLSWLLENNDLDDYYALVESGNIDLYEYSFMTSIIEKDGVMSLWNMQDEAMKEEGSFEKRFLYHESINQVLTHARQRERLYRVFRDNVYEVKAKQFGPAVQNAKEDYNDPRRNALVVQAFVDELYRIKEIGRPPIVEAKVVHAEGGERKTITWNVDLNELARIGGTELGFHNAVPLTASGHSNRMIKSAADLECDLILPKPMSVLVGDKVYESKQVVSKTGDVIEDLKEVVEFPDIRRLVNDRQIDFSTVLNIRKKAKRFRDWLQQESERDRDAIIAYHNEVSKASGLEGLGRKTLSLFGVLGSGATGSLIGSTLAGPGGAAAGGAIGSGVGFLFDIASKLGDNWKPVVFGDWLRNRIEKELQD